MDRALTVSHYESLVVGGKFRAVRVIPGYQSNVHVVTYSDADGNKFIRKFSVTNRNGVINASQL